MSFLAQLAHSLVLAPISPLKLKARAALYLVLYVLLAAGILGGLAWLLIANQEDLRQAILRYLLPESWTTTGGVMLDWFFATQTRAVLVNGTVSGTLVLISVLLFPVKEKVSAAFEKDVRLTSEPPHESRSSRPSGALRDEAAGFPLWFQGLEELKLVLLYVAAQMVIFWIGYHPNPLRKQAATLLSYAYLFATFSVDFISPVLQRHRLRYSQIVKTLLRHPAALVLFGAFFSLPAVLAGHHVARDPSLSFRDSILLLFAANLLGIIWGCLGGTWLGAKLLESTTIVCSARPPHRTTIPRVSSWPVRAVAWLAVLVTLGGGGYLFGGLALSVHHKSQILKCRYSMVAGSLRFAKPKLRSLLRGIVDIGVGFKLRIDNPTSFDVVIDRNRLEVRHEQSLVATSRLSPMRIPAGQQQVQDVRLMVETQPSVLLKGRRLLQDRWSLTLYVEVVDGFDFPIYLKHTFAETVREQLLGAKKR